MTMPDPSTAPAASPFAATPFEFRHRFWIIGATFSLGFSLFWFDHLPAWVVIARRLGGSGEGFEPWSRAVLGLGAALCILAALLRSWAEAYLHSSVVHDRALHAERLVADGPYRRMRNPLYLGLMLLAVGLGVTASPTGYAVITVLLVVFGYRLILREEADLLGSQGESYRRYLDAVPRLLPSLRPRVPAGETRPNWTDGLVGETFLWSFAAAMTIYAITEQLTWFGAVTTLGFLAYFVQGKLRGGQTEKGPR
jgi:protein-S-isoprenylcysteine O-methyltransferase Ste14